MAALPLPLQLKSWKGCNAELMAHQPLGSPCNHGSQGGNRGYGTDQPDEFTVYSSVQDGRAQRA